MAENGAGGAFKVGATEVGEVRTIKDRELTREALDATVLKTPDKRRIFRGAAFLDEGNIEVT